MPEELVLEEDVLGDLLGAPDEVRAAERRGGLVVGARGGGHPRSRPIPFIAAAADGYESSIARFPVSARKPCELMLTGTAP